MGTTSLVCDKMPVYVLGCGSSTTVILSYKTEHLHLHTSLKKKINYYLCTYFSRYLQVGGVQVSTEHPREPAVQQCHPNRTKRKKEAAISRTFFHSLFTRTPALPLPKSCFGSGSAQHAGDNVPPCQRARHSLPHSRCPPSEDTAECSSWAGGQGASRPAALGCPSTHKQPSPCITRCRCCAAFVPPAHPRFPRSETHHLSHPNPNSCAPGHSLSSTPCLQ